MKLEHALKIGLTLGMLAAASVAQAGREGNGGDICEDRIKIIRDDIQSWITKGGPSHLKLTGKTTLADYNQKMLEQIGSAKISCVEETVLVGNAEKTCKNFTDSQGASQIVCNVDRFMKNTSETDQYVLVHHEYAGLAGFETGANGDSDYTLSNQVTAFIADQVVKKLAIVPVRPVSGSSQLSFTPIPLNNYCGDQIPDGAACFWMGSPGSEANRSNDEKQHEVVLEKSFEMETTPVTQAQWFSAMGTNPSAFCSKEACPNTHQLVQGSGGTLTCLCPDNPVESVSYNDAQAFIQKLNTRNDGHRYALPTEAQWEYSARAGTSTAYYFGDDASQLGDHAWDSDNSGNHTHEVAQKGANAFGLYDMEGNVWQWTADWYGDDYGTPQSCNVSVDPVGPASGSLRVVRGGSWGNDAQNLRSASRGSDVPGDRNFYLGFRLVRTSP